MNFYYTSAPFGISTKLLTFPNYIRSAIVLKYSAFFLFLKLAYVKNIETKSVKSVLDWLYSKKYVRITMKASK